MKSDKADAVKIARYALDKWQNLKQYSVMDELRNQLKTMNRQFGFYMKHKTAMKNNLIGILDQTYPGVNTYFDSPARSDGSQKWVDFVSTYWHVDCVRKMSLNAFIDHYQNWCKRKKYNFSQSKAEEIYGKAKELVPVLPKDDITKLIIKQAVDQLNSASTTVESLRTLMNETASKLPEYSIVMAMKGVSNTTEEGREFALRVMKHLRGATDRWREETGLGFSLYGSPAESLCYRFASIDKEKFGDIENITDKGYYTNSYH